jgi:site-specific DNA-methyltransferase (adenine-specific)/modification methylase
MKPGPRERTDEGERVKPYYQDETATIYLADNREASLASLGFFDCVLTDPPYGIGFAAQPTNYQRLNGQKPEAWDNTTQPDVVLGLTARAAKVVIWGGNYYPLPPSRCWLSWFKPDAPPSMGDIELAWTNLDQCSRQITQSISATNAERVGHPTQKPLRVMRWSLERCALPAGSTVFDPFMGSGTTGVACAIAGMRFVGIEVKPEYCDMAVARIKRAKGIAADVRKLSRREIETPLFPAPLLNSEEAA